MARTSISCPECGARLAIPGDLDPSRTVTCPKCQGAFRPAKARKAAQPQPKATDEAEPDDQQDAPPATRKRRFRKKGASLLGPIIGLVLIGAFVLVPAACLGWCILKPPATDSGGTTQLAAKDKGTSPVTRQDPFKDWKEVRSEKLGFRAVMPQPVTEIQAPAPTAVGDAPESKFVHENATQKVSYIVRVVEFTDVQVQLMAPRDILAGGIRQYAKSMSGTIENEQPIELQGVQGRSFTVVTPQAGKFIIHGYFSGRRIYVVGVAGFDITPEAGGARHFFDSFQFTDKK